MKASFFIFVLFCYSLTASVQECAHFSDIKSFCQAGTLFVLDIDDTLLLPKQTLGTDVWFIYQTEQYVKKGFSKIDALERAIDDWEAIRHVTQVQIVEEGTAKIIEELQSSYPVMGLTTQGCSLASCTIGQLKSLQIDLSKSSPCEHECYFMNTKGVLFRKGVLFTAGTKKGEALLKLFSAIGYHPQRVVFINDKETHLSDVEETLLQNGIEFVGLRYNIGDERLKRFDPKLAQYQWEHSSFNHILSDDEARALMALKSF